MEGIMAHLSRYSSIYLQMMMKYELMSGGKKSK